MVAQRLLDAPSELIERGEMREEERDMSETEVTKSWWSRAALIGAVVALLLLPLGALGSRIGLWGFPTGFLFLAAGALLATVGVVIGIVGLILARKANRPADRPGLFAGIVISVMVLGFLMAQFNTASSVPPIHNISTDMVDPPAFDQVIALREGANPLEYDVSELVEFQGEQVTYGELQQNAYPDVRTHESSLTPEQALEAAVAVLESMGLQIVDTNPAEGTVEATATTFWFGFKDDVVVRIRETSDGSRIDVRSVSRVGQSDLGANAARIMAFLDGFSAAS
jgi:hypothetical protein